LIDIHCHILPGVDDGPEDISGFIEMAKAAVSSGITHLFATPHHLNGHYENSKPKILDLVQKHNEILMEYQIPILLHPGQELRIHRDLINTHDLNEVLTLDNNGKYLLLELPSGEVPPYTHDIVHELLLIGITPIIVHPERNKGFMEKHYLLFDLVTEGALVQLTAGSLLGNFGGRVRSFSEKIIEHQIAHFIASDAHHSKIRGFALQMAYEKINKKYGIEKTYYFKENTELLMLGQNIQLENPKPFRKKVLGLF
jgi:protein-tyrosine phosphatase